MCRAKPTLSHANCLPEYKATRATFIKMTPAWCSTSKEFQLEIRCISCPVDKLHFVSIFHKQAIFATCNFWQSMFLLLKETSIENKVCYLMPDYKTDLYTSLSLLCCESVWFPWSALTWGRHCHRRRLLMSTPDGHFRAGCWHWQGVGIINRPMRSYCHPMRMIKRITRSNSENGEEKNLAVFRKSCNTLSFTNYSWWNHKDQTKFKTGCYRRIYYLPSLYGAKWAIVP